MDANDLVQMLEDVEQRLIEDAAGPAPSGLTDPDPDGTERWEATQVWAHMAEFVSYWQAQLEHVVDSYRGQPVPFGRTKEDAARRPFPTESSRSERFAWGSAHIG